MKVLILEDDILTAELLNTVVFGLYANVVVTLVESLVEGRRALLSEQYDLLLCDLSVPDGSGLDLVKAARLRSPDLPVLVVTARTDRKSVLTAAHHRVNGFVSKPFDVDMIRRRLEQVLPTASAPVPAFDSLDDRLRNADQQPIRLPFVLDPADCLAMLAEADRLSVTDLTARWQDHAALTARLLEVANSSSFRVSGHPCQVLREAIHTMGVPMSLNQALALALDITRTLSDPRLQEQARDLALVSQSVARTAQDLARQIGQPPARAFTAGLLHRLGELAVVGLAQQHLNAGQPVTDEALTQALKNWSAPLGNRLKSQWGLPLSLRDLIGATHRLLRGSEPQARLMMRAAALIAQEQSDTEECRKLLRLIGIREPSL